jgi:maltose O-acetyltransferase
MSECSETLWSDEKRKMLAGELYRASDEQLVAERQRARELLREFNATRDVEHERRKSILHELFGTRGEGVWIEPPFYCDYGSNIRLGDRVYMNFNCVILDVTPVTIGDDVKLGPSVQLYAATHPIDSTTRNSGLEFGRPITIGSGVWIGGGTIVCPGVTIGERSVIGAGSVVTRDIPAGVLAVGNPCRVLRTID